MKRKQILPTGYLDANRGLAQQFPLFNRVDNTRNATKTSIAFCVRKNGSMFTHQLLCPTNQVAKMQESQSDCKMQQDSERMKEFVEEILKRCAMGDTKIMYIN